MFKMIETPTSSQIKAYGYDPISKTLAIVFTRGSGAAYHYSDCPQEVADGLAKADSVGKYFGANIKGKFAFTKVDASVPDEAQKDAAAPKPAEATAEA